MYRPVRLFRAMTLGAILALMLPLAAGLPAHAAGSSENTAPAAAADPTWKMAREAIANGNYDGAIPLLQQVVSKDPKQADALNYLGYALSRTGQVEDAKGFYAKALAINPDHRGANEYLGELYLKLGDLASAEERLNVLDKACFFGCDEYYALRDAIAEYKTSGSFNSRKRL